MFRAGIRQVLGRKVPLVMAVGVMVGAATLIAAPAASAAGPGFTISGVSTTPTTVSVGDQLETDIDFAVTDGTPAGRTATLTLPAALVGLPAGFDVRTVGGDLVATAAISSASPAVVTFTTTDFALTHVDVHGVAFVKDNFDATLAPPGQTTPLEYVTTGNTFVNELTVLPGSSIDRTGAFKFGQFVRTDQGRTDAEGAIYWFVESPVAPSGGWTAAEFQDVIPAGESLDCSTVRVTIGDGGGPGGGFENGSGFGSYHFATPCSATSLDLLTGAIPAGKIVRVQFTADLDSPTGVDSQTTFLNVAKVLATSVSGGTTSYPAGGTLVQSTAGGTAVGTNPTPGTTTSTSTSTESSSSSSSTEFSTSSSSSSTESSTSSSSSSSESSPSSSTESSTTDSSTTESSTTDSSTTEPSTTVPSTTESSTTVPSTTVPSTTLPSTSIVVSPTSSSLSTVTTDSTTPNPVSPSPTSPISTTSDGTTIQVLPTTETLSPTTSTDSGTTSEPSTTPVISTTTSTVLASTGAPVRAAAVGGGLLLLLGCGLLVLTRRRPSQHR